mmetsp:Transcript_20554/g.57087  ORF Transcript_20554/g.57087 Transcript_20554/m.57087 type:complete len:208 (-) Transcript_20554:250-873(-)
MDVVTHRAADRLDPDEGAVRCTISRSSGVCRDGNVGFGDVVRVLTVLVAQPRQTERTPCGILSGVRLAAHHCHRNVFSRASEGRIRCDSSRGCRYRNLLWRSAARCCSIRCCGRGLCHLLDGRVTSDGLVLEDRVVGADRGHSICVSAVFVFGSALCLNDRWIRRIVQHLLGVAPSAKEPSRRAPFNEFQMCSQRLHVQIAAGSKRT